MRKLFNRNIAYCSLATFFFLPFYITALESDQDQLLQWRSDGELRMSVEGEFRISVMSNNVSVTQGTLQIDGDEAIIEERVDSDEPPKITVHGSPVRYQQQLNDEGDVVVGSSDTMLFYTDEADGKKILELVGNATIQSPDTSMKCSAITYVAESDLFESSGPCEGVLSSTTN